MARSGILLRGPRPPPATAVLSVDGGAPVSPVGAAASPVRFREDGLVAWRPPSWEATEMRIMAVIRASETAAMRISVPSQ